MQRSFAEYDGFRKQRKITRREVFLAEMERVVPWRRLEALIELNYPLAGKDRKPYRLSTMLRVHLLQHWYGYSDPQDGGSAARYPRAAPLRGAGRGREPHAGRDDDPELPPFAEAHQLAESLV